MQRPLAKNLVYLLVVFILVGFRFTISAQALWETEREKEHGILRIKIEGISMDDYYFFVFKNSETKVRDTLRNQEQHLDLGNAKEPYSYSLSNLLKVMPNGLYGKNPQMIYSDWSYVSFPILGLSESDVFVENGKTKEKMRIHFILNPLDTVDYVFQLQFQDGDFLIEAPLLKQYALSNHYRNHKSSIVPKELVNKPFKHLKELAVIRSQTSNMNLSIVDIGNPEYLRYFPFHDQIRYSSQLESSVHFIPHAYYKKIKYPEIQLSFGAPEFMNMDRSDQSQNAYCVENIYVQPVYLYRPLDDTGLVNRKNIQVFRKRSREKIDTTFLQLENHIQSILFSKRTPCNAFYYSVNEVNFPFNSDSIVCLEITETVFRLPKNDSLALAKYVKKLNKEKDKAEKRSAKKRFPFFKRRNNVWVSPDPLLTNPPLPDYNVEIPQLLCDSFLLKQPFKSNFNNGYTSWEAVAPCFKRLNPKDSIQEFYVIVINPYTMLPYDIEVLFGPSVREVVYEEIIKENARLQELIQKKEFSFNEHHYKPELKRYFKWGLDQRNLIIYYGNEGEFTAYRKLKIPYERFN